MEFGSGYFGDPSVYSNDLNSHPNAYDAFGGPQSNTVWEGSKEHAAIVESSIEKPIIGTGDIGQSVAEGSRFGSLLKTSTDAIRRGAGWIELSTSMGGGAEATGAESYGKEAREALRDIARVNSVNFASVHTPVNIGNMSGYNPQERGFNDEHRKIEMEEVKKAIDFAGDLGAQAVVVHTGEFQRVMSDQPWAKNADGTYKFLSYDEEPGRAVLYMVDDRTGRMITEVRKNQFVYEPEFRTAYDQSRRRDRWVDKDGKFIDESNPDELFKRIPIFDVDRTSFKSKKLVWDDFVERANYFNKHYKKSNGVRWTPEEMFYRAQIDNQILQARGSSLYHGRFYDEELETFEKLKEALKYYEDVESKTSPEEAWKLLEQDIQVSGYARDALALPGVRAKFTKFKKPTEIIRDAIDKVHKNMKYTHEASASADSRADELTETLKHVLPVEVYAKRKTTQSYAEAGIYAMKKTQRSKFANKPVYVAPENIFPEMGYGSHPDELIEMVQLARKEMVNLLTAPKIKDKHERMDRDGNIMMVNNPHYQRNLTKAQAEKKAYDHIKTTFDTQHLGMWWKHFQGKPGESIKQRKKRFDKWYMKQVKKMADSGVLGHLHVVDSIGAGHHHLPVGQGDLPVKEAVEYIKKHKKFRGTMVSEAWGEEASFGSGRILTETWRAFGSNIRNVGVPSGASPVGWQAAHHLYGRTMQSPYFIFGSYSPSNDWQLWSQVPME